MSPNPIIELPNYVGRVLRILVPENITFDVVHVLDWSIPKYKICEYGFSFKKSYPTEYIYHLKGVYDRK